MQQKYIQKNLPRKKLNEWQKVKKKKVKDKEKKWLKNEKNLV